MPQKYRSDLSERNVTALQAVLNLVRLEPDKHDQDIWGTVDLRSANPDPVELQGRKFFAVACPSTACVAGWATTLAGAKFVVPDSIDPAHWGGITLTCESVLTLSGEVVPVDDHAQAILGITEDEANRLFSYELTREKVIILLEQLIKGKHIIKKDGRYKKLWDDDEDDEYL